jgi:hypothetical protein
MPLSSNRVRRGLGDGPKSTSALPLFRAAFTSSAGKRHSNAMSSRRASSVRRVFPHGFVVLGKSVMRAVFGSGACGKSRPAARYGGSGRITVRQMTRKGNYESSTDLSIDWPVYSEGRRRRAVVTGV